MITKLPMLLVFVPIIVSIFIYVTQRPRANLLAFAVQAVLIGVYLQILGRSDQISGQLFLVGGWTLESGIALKLDALSMAFIGMALFIWTVVLFYLWPDHHNDHKFLFFFLFLQGTFLGLLLVNDLFSFFIFVEICTILISILVVYKKDGFSLRAGMYYLVINTMGMQAYVLGLVFVYKMTGTLNWDRATAILASIGPTPGVIAGYVLMMSGICVKAAFAPTFNWLSRAHGAAPAPISTLLSALLVKAGLYGFIRISQLFGDLPLAGDFFLYLGFATALSGTFVAIAQKDIKQLLASSTVSQVGLILIGVSQFGSPAYYGGLVHMVAHAGFKSVLFMGAGLIINGYGGERRLTDIRGVRHRYPVMSLIMGIAILSIIGTPFLSGYPGKYIIGESLRGAPVLFWLFQLLGLGTMIYYLKFAQIFLPEASPRRVSQKPNLPMAAGAALCIVLPYAYGSLGTLLGLDLPVVSLFSLEKLIIWALSAVVAVAFFRSFIFSDYLTPLMHRIREINVPFYVTAYMFLSLIAIMFVFTL